MSYLMIRNPGVADYRSLTLIGASITREAGRAGTIGMFGSGSKLAAVKFLRDGLPFYVCPGTLTMEWKTKPEIIKGNVYNRVVVKFKGTDEISGNTKNDTEEFSFSTEWGVQDWTKLGMALREFVSNAIDGAIEAGGNYNDVKFEVVDKPRAKRGYTSVYIPFTPEVEKAFSLLPLTFLHLGAPELLSQNIFQKRNCEDKKNTLIYKNGVLVTRLEEESIYDYNLGEDLTLDESRNANVWVVKAAIAKRIAQADVSTLIPLVQATATGDNLLEMRLDSDYLSSYATTGEEKQRRARNFQDAFFAVFGPNAVATEGLARIDNFISRKGLTPVTINAPSWLTAFGKYGIPTSHSVLSTGEREGKEEGDPTPQMLASLNNVWALLELCDMTKGKEKPEVKSFTCVMDGETIPMGYYTPGEKHVCINSEFVPGRELNITMLEEVCHYVTGSTDNSRDLQDFAFRMIAKLALDKTS